MLLLSALSVTVAGAQTQYVDGPVAVTGDDPYDLDRDGDGVACES